MRPTSGRRCAPILAWSKAAIEESLRVDSPAQMVLRRATEDVDGRRPVTIQAGDLVMVYLASANRDPGRWADPANFACAASATGTSRSATASTPASARRWRGWRRRRRCSALVARFATIERGAERGRRLPGGMLFGFQSLPMVFR